MRRVEVESFSQELGMTLQRREWVADLVGEHGAHLAERSEPAIALEPLVLPLLPEHVLVVELVSRQSRL